MKEFQTTHNLPFEIAPFEMDVFDEGWLRFRVGTCQGVWNSKGKQYRLLAVDNSEPGNGHFDDVLEWFEHSAKRDKKDFVILELWNERLAEHLKTKRGFKEFGYGNLHLRKGFSIKERLKVEK